MERRAEPPSWDPKGMVDSELLAALELLTPAEQKALIAIADYLKARPNRGTDPRLETESLLAELPVCEPSFTVPDEVLSPARKAARRFMRENSTLMRLLAR